MNSFLEDPSAEESQQQPTSTSADAYQETAQTAQEQEKEEGIIYGSVSSYLMRLIPMVKINKT